MIGGDVPLNVNFALRKLLLGAAAVLSRIVTNALFASQFVTMECLITNHVH